MIKKYVIWVFVLLPIFCRAQYIPPVSNPVPVNKQTVRSKIPDSQIQNHKYVWYLIYSDKDIQFVRQMGGNQPKEVGPLTEETCMACIQDCKREGITVGFAKRLNPQYRPPANKQGSADVDQPVNSAAGDAPYDPTEDAIKRLNQKKPVINDANVVDLSGLKDPYSAHVEPFKPKDPLLPSASKEKCQEAINYATNRIKALEQMIGNSANLVAQQAKSVETMQGEVENWTKSNSETNLDIGKDIVNVSIDMLGQKFEGGLNMQLEELRNNQQSALNLFNVAEYQATTAKIGTTLGKLNKAKKIGLGYGLIGSSSDALSLAMDAPKEDFLTKTLPNAYIGGLNYIDGIALQIPGVTNLGLYSGVHKALVYAPLFTDMLLGIEIKKNLQAAHKNMESTRLKANLLGDKIISWQNELKALKDCGANCDQIKIVMNRYRPDFGQ